MNILEFADVIDQEIQIIYFPNQDGRFSAAFHGEIKDGAVLCSMHGNGKTAASAMNDYADQIAGKRIVFNAMSSGRKEFVAPKHFVDIE